MIELASGFAFEIAAQDDGLAGKESFQSLGVVDSKYFGEAPLNLIRVLSGQNFAAKREVKFVHLARCIPCCFYRFLQRMYEVLQCFTSTATVE